MFAILARMTLPPLRPEDARAFLRATVAKTVSLMSAGAALHAKFVKEFPRSSRLQPDNAASIPQRANEGVESRSQELRLQTKQFPLHGRDSEPSNAYENSAKNTMIDPSALGWQLARATTFYNFAMGALVLGSVITIAATIGLIWSSGMKNRYADAHLANAFAVQEQAKLEAAKANERAAELLLRARQAKLDDEKTHLELEQARAISGPRRISTEQRAKIVKALVGHPMNINLLSPSNDPEAKQFAEDLTATLRAAGLTVNVATSVLYIPMHGLGMTMSSAETSSVLYAALHGAGLKINDLPKREPIMIVVGSK